MPRLGRSWLWLAAALPLLAGCGGGKDLIDDSLSSPDQIRSLVQQFQGAMAKRDDGAACDLMNERMRDHVVVQGVPPDSPQSHCSIEGAFFYPGERSSLPTAHIVEIRPDRHDQLADVYLDDGSRFRLRREGESADGEWRVNAINFHSFAVPPAKVAEVSADTPACRGSALGLSQADLGSAATGEHGARFLLTNRSKGSCLLRGYPQVELLRGTQLVPFNYQHGGGSYLPRRQPETILVPSGLPAIFLAVKYRCDAGDAYVANAARVTLPAPGSEPLRLRWPANSGDFEYCEPFRGDPANDPGNTVAVSPFLASVRDLYDE